MHSLNTATNTYTTCYKSATSLYSESAVKHFSLLLIDNKNRGVISLPLKEHILFLAIVEL